MFFSAILLLFVGAASSAAPPMGKQADYFAGVFLLQANAGIPDSLLGTRYRELEAVTGISTAEARVLLQQYRQKPAEWKILYDSISVRLARPQAVLKDTAGKPLMYKKRR